MDIIIRNNHPYKDVSIVAGGTTIDLGLLDAEEVKELVGALGVAIGELLS